MMRSIRNSNKELKKVILISLILLLYTIVMLCFSEKLLPYMAFYFSGIVILVIPMIYLYVFLFSIRTIKSKPNNIFNWIPLMFLIINLVLVLLFEPAKINYDFDTHFDNRNFIVNKIKNDKVNFSDNSIFPLQEKYKKLSCDGNVKIFLNNENELLIGFCLTTSVPDGGSYFIYSSGGKELINDNILLIGKIKRKAKNWYYVLLN